MIDEGSDAIVYILLGFIADKTLQRYSLSVIPVRVKVALDRDDAVAIIPSAFILKNSNSH